MKLNINRVKNALFVGVSVLGLASCAAYNVVGTFEESGKEFIGNVTVSVGDIGWVKVETLDGSVKCSGTSVVTKRPSGYTLVGAQGRATAECSDGTTFKVDFLQTSHSGGHGKGIDSNGNIVSLYFDRSSDVLVERMRVQKLDRLVQ